LRPGFQDDVEALGQHLRALIAVRHAQADESRAALVGAPHAKSRRPCERSRRGQSRRVRGDAGRGPRHRLENPGRRRKSPTRASSGPSGAGRAAAQARAEAASRRVPRPSPRARAGGAVPASICNGFAVHLPHPTGSGGWTSSRRTVSTTTRSAGIWPRIRRGRAHAVAAVLRARGTPDKRARSTRRMWSGFTPR